MDIVYVATLAKLIGSCGLTVRDVMALRKSNFDLDTGLIKFTTPKTNHSRTATIPPLEIPWFTYFLNSINEELFSSFTERSIWATLKSNNIGSIKLRQKLKDKMEELGASEKCFQLKMSGVGVD